MALRDALGKPVLEMRGGAPPAARVRRGPIGLAAVLAVARFAEHHADRLVELDINPLIVRPAGKGAVAADVLIRLGASA